MRTDQSPAWVMDDELPSRKNGSPGARPPGADPDAGASDPVVDLVHDLRSPLASILVLSEMLMQGTSDPGSLERHQLALLNGAAQELTTLLAEAVDMVKGEDERLDEDPDGFSIGEVLGSVATVVRPLAESKGIAVRTLCLVEDRRTGHRPALRRVLLNLATNAVKYTDEGSVQMVAMPQPEGRVSVSVRDTGKGLPPAVAEALEQPLSGAPAHGADPFRVRNLGLTICRRLLLQSLGSELEFETCPEHGTTFQFALDLPPTPNGTHRSARLRSALDAGAM